jgi:hypothetical protein
MPGGGAERTWRISECPLSSFGDHCEGEAAWAFAEMGGTCDAVTCDAKLEIARYVTTAGRQQPRRQRHLRRHCSRLARDQLLA